MFGTLLNMIFPFVFLWKLTPSAIYEGWSEGMKPFWISRELIAWPWCNLAASQRKPYCPSVNSQSPVGLVSRQWDAVDWACVLCDRRIHNDRASRSASSLQCACPLYSSRTGFPDKASHHPGLSAPLQLRFGSLRLMAFPKAKITIEREEICECYGHDIFSSSKHAFRRGNPSCFLFNGYNGCFAGIRQSGRKFNQISRSSFET